MFAVSVCFVDAYEHEHESYIDCGGALCSLFLLGDHARQETRACEVGYSLSAYHRFNPWTWTRYHVSVCSLLQLCQICWPVLTPHAGVIIVQLPNVLSKVVTTGLCVKDVCACV